MTKESVESSTHLCYVARLGACVDCVHGQPERLKEIEYCSGLIDPASAALRDAGLLYRVHQLNRTSRLLSCTELGRDGAPRRWAPGLAPG